MRAAAYVRDETIRLEEREPADPAPGQVRLDVAYVGICGTDLHIKHGAWTRASRCRPSSGTRCPASWRRSARA